MRRIAAALILTITLSSCQSVPVQGIQAKWQKAVHPCLPVEPWGLVWSPDSKKLAYLLDSGAADALIVVDLQTRSSTHLIDISSVGLEQWSPDGSRILLHTHIGRASLIDADGSDMTYLPEILANSRTAWFPDSSHIAYLNLPESDFPQLFILDIETEVATQIISGGPFFNFVVSPDGKRIAFERPSDSVENGYDLMVANTDGSNIRQVATALSNGDLAWSPDGRQLAFLSSDDRTLNVVATDGTGLNQLTTDATSNFGWLADSTGLIMIKATGYPPDESIIRVSLDGSNSSLTTFHYEYDPALSPDGTKVAYLSSDQGLGDVYVMNVDGSNKVQLTHNTGYKSCIDWPF